MGFFDTIKNKYNFKTKKVEVDEVNVGDVENLPETDLKDNIEDNSSILFEAFYTNNLGPTMYYLVELIENEYIFKYGYKKEYQLEEFNGNELKILKKGKEEYDFIIDTIKNKMKDWKNIYNNGFILDGTNWYIKFLKDNIVYEGNNDFPSNLKEVLSILENAFSKDKKIELESENKDINDGEENDSLFNDKNNKIKPHKIRMRKEINNEFIEFKIITEHNSYVLMLEEEKLLFDKESNKIKNIPILVDNDKFLEFSDKINNITLSWEKRYEGDKKNKWSLKISTSTNQKSIEGIGGFPENWNDLINLVSEYELFYKECIGLSNSNNIDEKNSIIRKTDIKSKIDQYI